MGNIDIKKVENSRSPYYRGFIELSFTVYQENQNWVPWFNKEMQSFIDRHHPLFAHSVGDFFVALKGNETEGRMFVFEKRLYNKTHSMNNAYFYFVDFFDDGEVAEKLFQTAVDWPKPEISIV
jgi:c-di-AMP phosphodiesterase-like protein